MEIRHLQTFIAIVEQGGFTKAAEHLGYAQSTITAHIQILEDEIGEPLFNRLGKKVILTHTGKKLVSYAKSMLEVYAKIKEIAVEEKEVSGDLIIGVSESLTIYRLGTILKEYKKNYPRVNLILKSAKCSDLRQKLYNGQIDMMLTIEPKIKEADLMVQRLKDEEMVIIGALESDLSFLQAEPKDELIKENIILSEEGCMARIAFENDLKEKKIRYRNPIEVASVEAIKNCVMNGLGISVLPYYVVKNEIDLGQLKMVQVGRSFPQFQTQLVYHKGKSISLPMQKLIEVIVENIESWV